MAIKDQRRQGLGGLLGFGAAVAAVLATLAIGPAQAQRMFDWFGNFGNYPSSPRERSPEREVDYSRAPAAKKPDTAPTTTVLVMGDSMADWLAYGLEDALSDMPEFGVLRRHRTVTGLIRYDSRNENMDWAQAARETIAAEKPQFIVFMIGLSDRTAIRERIAPPRGTTQPNQRGAAPAAAATPPAATPTPAPQPNDPQTDSERSDQAGTEPAPAPAPEPAVRGRAAAGAMVTHEFRSERWAELYSKRIDDVIAVMKARGVPVYWVGLPAIRGQRSMSEVAYLNDLYRGRAEKAGITYVDVWDGFVDESNRFVLQGPDFEGQVRKLRTPDGAYFTKAGARKLAHYVEREIRRASLHGPVPVALPTTEPQPQTPAAKTGGGPTQRPMAGPVMPLTANAATNENLVGTSDSGAIAHVTATRVLVKGEAVPAPAGRSDDFAWPRRGIAPVGSDPVVATTTLPLPVMQAAPAQTTVPVPTGETPAVVAAVRRPPRPQTERQYQQPRNNNFFGFPSFFSRW